MEQKNITDLSPFNKWVTIIFFLTIIPPLGIYYIWKDIEYFKKYLPSILLLYGGSYFVFATIALTQWLPAMKEDAIRNSILPTYTKIGIVLIILFSLFCIVLSFLASSKIKSFQTLPQSYINIILVSLFMLLVIVPLLIIYHGSLMYKEIFRQMDEIDARYYNNVKL